MEPITPEILRLIIERERPDACLPTMGGQTGLNTAVEAYEKGIFSEFNVQLIGDLFNVLNANTELVRNRNAASPNFELLSQNPLNEYCLSSPAISQGQIFIRTTTHLWVIGERKNK